MTKIVQNMHLLRYFYAAGLPRGHKWDTNDAGGADCFLQFQGIFLQFNFFC